MSTCVRSSICRRGVYFFLFPDTGMVRMGISRICLFNYLTSFIKIDTYILLLEIHDSHHMQLQLSLSIHKLLWQIPLYAVKTY